MSSGQGSAGNGLAAICRIFIAAPGRFVPRRSRLASGRFARAGVLRLISVWSVVVADLSQPAR